MPRFSATLLAVLFLLLPVSSGRAQSSPRVAVPSLINFSGTLPETSGGAIAVATGVTFAIYKQQEGGAPLWMETQNVTPDAAGRYTVLLGGTKPDGVPAELFSEHEERWLGVQVQGQTEQPRVLLVSVPYAMKAAEADKLAGHNAGEFVTTDKLQSAVQQQMQQQGVAPVTATSSTLGTKAANGKKSPITTNPATNFTDTTANQVVLVTQNGSGSGLKATATTGQQAVLGTSANVGVSGVSTGSNSGSIGVYGTSKGIGLKGASTDVMGSSAGVLGTSSAPTGYAIYGSETAGAGLNYGVYGKVASTSGIGLRGAATATAGNTIGLLGTSASVAGIGMKGQNVAASGTTYGIQAIVQSPNGTALQVQNLVAGGTFINAVTGQTSKFSVDGSGNVTAQGNYTGLSNLNIGGTGQPTSSTVQRRTRLAEAEF